MSAARHAARVSSALVAAAAVAGCYVAPDPAGLAADQLVQFIIPEGLAVEADGVSLVDLQVKVAPTTTATTVIVVETSSGVLSVSADPTKPEARRVTLTNLGTGVFDLELRVGNIPGDTLITASAGGFSVTGSLDLDPSPATKIVLSAPKTSISADGEARFDVTAALYAAEQGARVSEGARVDFRVCCPDAAGDPAPCAGAEPLVVVSAASLGAGTQAIVVQAVSERIVAAQGTPVSIPVLLVAEAATGDGPAVACAAPAPGAVRGTLALAVRPIAGP